MIGNMKNIIEKPFIHNETPEHRRKGRAKGRFKRAEKVQASWQKKRETFKREYLKSKMGISFSRGANSMERLFNALADPDSSINKEHIDCKDYAMPTYKYDFIKIESFVPRNSNKSKYRMLIPREVYLKWAVKKRQEERNKVFDTYAKIVYTKKKLEKEHIDFVKSKYDKYFETRNY
tara:strand:+ start:47 stop:577 length:531 start_codon:yes stop_codon:yes gene_type:complete